MATGGTGPSSSMTGVSTASPAASSIATRWRQAAGLVAATRDVLNARPVPDAGAPDALVARGWAPFLLALSDPELDAFEARGQDGEWSAGAPASLVALVDAIRDVCAMPSLAEGDDGSLAGSLVGLARPARRLETPRKRAQIAAFARLVLPLAAEATRVVDVGSGHGHLTRELAERLALPVIGLERDAGLAERARGLTTHGDASFATTDVLSDGLAFSAGDCAVGLHACGELGDAMVEAIAAVPGRASVALVGCCLQKRRAASRASLVPAARELSTALDLPSRLLGLSNLTPRDDGVEAARAENLLGRQRRLALHRLLSARAGPMRLGSEIDGLNRRAAQQDVHTLVTRAFALRGWPAPSREAIDEAAAWARTEHARSRRLSLPRAMLGRVLEVFVLLDRALYLEQRGFDVSVGTLFAPAVSARNLVLIARR